MFAKRASRHSSSPHSPGLEPNAMKAASDILSPAPVLGGPAAAVLVAVAGAALVAIGLLLVGVRGGDVGQWVPTAPVITQAG